MLTDIRLQYVPKMLGDLADIIQNEITRIADETNKKLASNGN